MDYPNTSIDYPLYPENVIYTSEDTCCTKPPNPWTQSPPVGPQGCQCDTTCVNKFGPNPVRYRSESPDKRLPASCVTNLLDTKAAAFAADAKSVSMTQNASLVSPSSTSATLAAIPAQNAAGIVNANNKVAAASQQVLAVAAASNSTMCNSASRLALVTLTDANAAYNVSNTNADDFAVLVHTIKLDSDAQVIASTAANVTATSIYNNAQGSLTAALETVTDTETAAAQARLDATTALCNCVRGSGAYTLQLRNNNINVTSANHAAEVASIAANSLMQSVNAIQAVSQSTTNALIDANTAAVAIQAVDTLYQNALAAKAAYNVAMVGYHDTSGNFDTLSKSIIATAALASMNAAYALLLPSTQISDIVTKCMTASRSANLAAANARALSGVLGAAAKAAAIPSMTIVTAQNIATQTAAAERFGAAAAAAAARMARLSAAPPIPPTIPVPNLTEYRIRMPS